MDDIGQPHRHRLAAASLVIRRRDVDLDPLCIERAGRSLHRAHDVLVATRHGGRPSALARGLHQREGVTDDDADLHDEQKRDQQHWERERRFDRRLPVVQGCGVGSGSTELTSRSKIASKKASSFPL